MAMDRTTRAAEVGKWILAAVIPASAMAIGTLHATVLIVITMLAALSCVLVWLDPPRRASRASRWAMLGIGLALGASILQAVPLPSSVVAVVAPANADAWSRALSPLRESGPTWHSISVAPPATHAEILKGILYACIFLASLRVVLSEGGSRFLEAVIIASAALVALTSLAHAAVAAHKVFGVYEPREILGFSEGRLGPLLNSNHLAAYMNIGAAVALGTALASRRRAVGFVLAAAAGLLLIGTGVWVASRGGTAGVVVVAVLVIGLTLYAHRKRPVGIEPLAVGAALVAAGVFVALGTSDLARSDLSNHDLGKLELGRSALSLVPSSPVFGVGRGAFETVYPMVQHSTTYYSFHAAENVVAQWLVEWGMPASVAISAAFAMALRPSVVFSASHPPIGPWVAIIVTLLHDIVDFHLEVPGVVIPVVVCIAIVVGKRASSRGTRSPKEPAFLRRAAFASSVAAVAAAALVATNVGHSLIEDRDRTAASAVNTSMSHEAFRSELRGMMLRYPAEPFFPLAGAIRAQANGEPVIAWVARALERYPEFGRAHLVLARDLSRRHRAQARLEYRLAWTGDSRLEDRVVSEAAGLVDGYDSALELVSDGARGADFLEKLSARIAERLPSTNTRIDTEIIARDPKATGPRKRQIAAATSDIRNEHAWCADRASCAAPALVAARELVAEPSASCEAHIALARLRIAIGETTSALDDLAHSGEQAPDRAVCLRALVELSMESGDKRRADSAFDLALRSGCGTREECTRLYSWAASTAEGHQNHVRALALYKRAAEVDPDNPQHLQHAADIAERLGLEAEAADAYDKMAARDPDGARWKKRADELRLKSRQRAFAPPR